MKKFLKKTCNTFSNINFMHSNKKTVKLMHLCAITDLHENVIFIVEDSYTTTNGIDLYNVDTVYIDFNDSYSRIDSISIEGVEIDNFKFSDAIEPNVVFDKKKGLSKINYKAKPVSFELGRFHMDNINITVKLDSFFHMSSIFLKTTNKLFLYFSQTTDLNFANKVFDNIKRLFSVFYYRNNISFNTFDTYFNQSYNGLVKRTNIFELENENNLNKYMLNDSIIGNSFSRMIQSVVDNEMYFDHICDYFRLRDKYNLMRMGQIFSAFEFIYKKRYGVDSCRSEYYKQVKEEVIDSIKMLKSNKDRNSKEKKALNSIISYLKNYDDSYEAKIQKAVNDNFIIISPFLLKYFEHSNSDIIKNIPIRLGLLRNNIQHGNIDYIYKEILQDIKILEILYYIILLKDHGIDNKNIIEGIEALF